MNSMLKRNLLHIVGALLGAVGGFAYWHFVGCQSGTCPITSSPYISTIYGAVLGALLLSMFKKKETDEK